MLLFRTTKRTRLAQLTKAELVSWCSGTLTGRPLAKNTIYQREIILRLGLLGMRAQEICSLNVANIGTLPTIAWTGKRRKPRRAIAGSALCDAQPVDGHLHRSAGTAARRNTPPPLSAGPRRQPTDHCVSGSWTTQYRRPRSPSIPSRPADLPAVLP